MYTTVTKVREAGGFVGNTNIPDSKIANIIKRAESRVNSYVGDAYLLPLPKYYFQTIAFSGTGGGTPATLTITIDGSNYAFTVATGMTAAQAADAFRAAALNNDSFVVDALGDGTTVTIYSIDGDDPTSVTITSTDPQTANSITATGGTVTETSIPLIEALTTDTAVAMLFITEYGEESEGTGTDGFKLLAETKTTLKAIKEGDEKVYDFNGQELPPNTTMGFHFYPTTASQTDEDNPTASKFTMNNQY